MYQFEIVVGRLSTSSFIICIIVIYHVLLTGRCVYTVGPFYGPNVVPSSRLSYDTDAMDVLWNFSLKLAQEKMGTDFTSNFP